MQMYEKYEIDAVRRQSELYACAVMLCVNVCV